MLCLLIEKEYGESRGRFLVFREYEYSLSKPSGWCTRYSWTLSALKFQIYASSYGTTKVFLAIQSSILFISKESCECRIQSNIAA